MSFTSNKTKKFSRIKNSNNEIFTFSFDEEKNNDYNTISTIEKVRFTKNKTVSFKQVEIINVESYKKYNQIGILSLESIENNCSKICGACDCDIF